MQLVFRSHIKGDHSCLCSYDFYQKQPQYPLQTALNQYCLTLFYVRPSFRAVSLIVLFRFLLWLFSTSAMKGPIQFMLYCLFCLFPYHMSNQFRFFQFFSFWFHSNAFCPVLLQSPWLEIILDHFVFIRLLKQSFTDACNLFQGCNLFSMFHSNFKGRC